MARQLSRFVRNEIISLTGEIPVYDLAESVGPDLELGDLLGDRQGGVPSDFKLGYGTPEGNADLRAAIAANHGVTADEVVTMSGGMQSLFLIAYILCDPGDEVVTTSPLFPNTRATLLAVGARVNTLDLRFEDGYAVDPQRLAELMTPRTRLVSLASPQNPSGTAIPAETITEILARMEAICPDAYLLVDETYREAPYGDAPCAPSMVTLDPRVISCASLSKCHGAPGLRIGWAVSQDKAMLEQLTLGKFNTTICCSPLDEALALRVLSSQDEIVGSRRTRLADGLERTSAWVAQNSDHVEWVKPDAGALCCVRLRPEAVSDEQVDEFYSGAEQQGVRVAPGTWFGENKRVFRLGFGYLPTDELDKALSILSEVLDQL